MLLIQAATVTHAQPPLEFDLAFLELGGGHGGADLSVFATSNRLLPGRYVVDVFVNDVFVEKREMRFDATSDGERGSDALPCLTLPMLEEWGVHTLAFPALVLAGEPDACVNLPAAIAEARVAFDSYRHLLAVNVPQAAMKRRARGAVDPQYWERGINTARLGYQFSATRHGGSDFGQAQTRNTLYASLRGSASLGSWRLSHAASFLRGLNGRDRFQVIDAFAQRDIVPWKSRLLLGEGTTPSDIFDGFPFRGIQLGSDESMLPDSLRGYAPVIHGVAQTNAQITIRQNGFAIYNTFVPPGPFTLDDLYPTASSGDLEVTITEADGHETRFIQPYAAVPALLREGVWRYNVTLGQYRNGLSDPNPTFGMASVARGFPGELSLYGGTIAADTYQSARLGIGKNLGRLGGVAVDVSHSRSRTHLADDQIVSGRAVRVLYAKSLPDTGTDLRISGEHHFSRNYRSFDDAARVRQGAESLVLGAGRNRIEGTISQRLGEGSSLYATVGVQTHWTANVNRLYQIGYSSRVGTANVGLYGNYTPGGGVPSRWNVSLSISVPLEALWGGSSGSGRKAAPTNLTYFLSRDHENRLNQQMGVSGSAGSDGLLSYSMNATHANQGSASRSASLSYLASSGRFDASAATGPGYTQTTLAAAGGVLWSGDGLLLTQPMGETVAVATVPDAKGVHFERYPGVSTNRDGKAVIPHLNPYRINRIAIETGRLPRGVEIRNPVTEVVPTRGAVVRADFDAIVGVQAAFALIDAHGAPLPLGAMAENDEGQVLGVVGTGGLAFVGGLQKSPGSFLVRWGGADEQRCRVHYALLLSDPDDVYPYVEAVCR
ncbi:fimbria/pilus outer membrane usher protein [Stenotrophomonas sp. LARHCG68]